MSMVGSRSIDEPLPVVGDQGAGVPLTLFERSRLDFSRAPVVHARWAKAAAYHFDVDDWLAYYDPTLSVGELIETYGDASASTSTKTLREIPLDVLGGVESRHYR